MELDGFGMFNGGGPAQYGGPVGLARSRDPRFAYAQALANSALDTSTPIRSNLQGVGQLAKAAVSALAMNKLENEYQNRDADYARSVADVLKAQSGTPAETRQYTTPDDNGNPTVINWNAVAPDPNRAIQIAAANRDTAPLAISMATEQNRFNQQRAAAKEDRTANQDFTRDMQRVGQEFTAAQAELTRAQQAALQNSSQENQRALQEAQQRFTAAQQASAQAFQLSSAGQIAADRQRGENTANLAPVTIQTPNGPQVVPAGAAVAIAKEGASGKMTDEQAKAAGWADRMMVSHGIIGKHTDASTSRYEATKADVPLIGNSLVSNDKQQAVQAERDFLNAILRRESGAAVSESERQDYGKQFFPRPGDGPDVIRQKAADRALAIQGMVRSAGDKYRPIQGGVPMAGASGPAPPPGFTIVP